jgi:hypothetical protein
MPDEQYFGLCGDPHLNDMGSRVVPMMQRCALRAATTFYENGKHSTFNAI